MPIPEKYRGMPHLGTEVMGALNGRTSPQGEIATGFEYTTLFPQIYPALEVMRQKAVENRLNPKPVQEKKVIIPEVVKSRVQQIIADIEAQRM